MPQHISVRVPWHDHGWDGTVCMAPESNNACLRLRNIAENRKDKEEVAICGQHMADYGKRFVKGVFSTKTPLFFINNYDV